LRPLSRNPKIEANKHIPALHDIKFVKLNLRDKILTEVLSMKKAILRVAAILLSISFFVACASTTEQVQETATSEHLYTSRLTIEELLYDFDYMMQLMEDTFLFFGVAERRLGIDIRQLAQETRDIIENYPYSLQDFASELGIAFEDMPELDEQIFGSILYHEFFSHFQGFAHSRTLTFSLYDAVYPIMSNPGFTQFTRFNSQAFTNPNTQRFYEEQGILFQTLAEENPVLFQFIFRTEPPIVSTQLSTRPIITTDIIEEGRIAYLNISSFMTLDLHAHRSRLVNFYRDVQEYEHLIIDVRDNFGGSHEFWRMLVMYPLWRDRDYMPNMPLYSFYTDSELGQFLAEIQVRTESISARHSLETDNLLPIDEILATANLPYLNEEDLQSFSHGIRFNTSLADIDQAMLIRFGLGHIPHIPFNGQIWLLVHEDNRSGPANFGLFAKHQNFATLVGEQAGGSYGLMAFFSLPNSGIMVSWDINYLTDQYGRSIEEFPTAPHYFNLPGMDALETVLYLIESR